MSMNCFRLIITADRDVPDSAPPLLRDYLAETHCFPNWFDDNRVRRSEAFFRRHGKMAVVLEATAGLTSTYVNPAAARTMHATHQLDHPQRRLAHSARLYKAMADKDAYTAQSRLIPTCQKVRLVHATVRQLLTRSQAWDGQRDGVPISQFYIGGGILIFSIEVLDAMSRLGIDVTDEQQDGYYYAWRLVNYWLGYPDEPAALPNTVSDARTLWRQIRDVPEEWGPTNEGVILTTALVEYFEGLLPPGLKGLVPAFLRLALTDPVADLVQVPHSRVEFGVRLEARLAHAVSAHHPHSHVIAGAVDLLHTAIAEMHQRRDTEKDEPELPDRLGSAP